VGQKPQRTRRYTEKNINGVVFCPDRDKSPVEKYYRKGAKAEGFCHPPHEVVGGKPEKPEADVAATTKKRPKDVSS